MDHRLGLLALALFLGSCSASIPQIRESFSQLNYYLDTRDAQWREELALFLHVENKDGIEDIDKVYVLHDSNELLWELGQETWTRIDRPSEVWIGSNHLWMPAQEVLPRGNFRVQILNKSGSRTETTINVDSPKISEYKKKFLQVQQSQGNILLTPPPDSYLIWIYGRENQFLTSVRGGEAQVPVQQVLSDPNVKQQAGKFYIYTFEERLGVGLVQGPYTFE